MPAPQPPARPANHQQPAPPAKHADPQAAKVEGHAAIPPAFTPEPALDPRAQKPPEGAYADGMPVADEQRARSAWIEEHGDKAYHEAVDERPPEERTAKQVPGVAPPAKRS
jgi:hypothetical protein